MSDQPQKCCSRCKTTKERDQFSSNIHNKDGLQDWCKPCTQAYGRAKREAKKQQQAAESA